MHPPPKPRRRHSVLAIHSRGACLSPEDRRIQDNSDIPNAELDVDMVRVIAQLGAGSSSPIPYDIAFSLGHGDRGADQSTVVGRVPVSRKCHQSDPDDPATSRGKFNLTVHRAMVDRMLQKNEVDADLHASNTAPDELCDPTAKEESINRGPVLTLKALELEAIEAHLSRHGARRSDLGKDGRTRFPFKDMDTSDKEQSRRQGEKYVSSRASEVTATQRKGDQSQPHFRGNSQDRFSDRSSDQTDREVGYLSLYEVLRKRERLSAEEEQPAAEVVEPRCGSGANIETDRHANPRRSRFRRPKKEATPHQPQSSHRPASPPPDPPATRRNSPVSALGQFFLGTLSKLRTEDRAAPPTAPPPPAPLSLPPPPRHATPKSMNSAYLDSPNGMTNPLPRQPPNPGSGHQQNGSGGMPNLVNGLLSGGHQTDMNHLWQVVQQLSDVLQENRNQTANIMNSVQQIQTRAAQEGTSPTLAQVNGDLNLATTRHQAAEINNLRAQLQSAHATITTLDTSSSALRALVADYETSLSLVLDKLRPYAHQHHDAILALHAHYNGLLEKERQANLELRLEHQQWQAGLGRVAAYARTALKESADAGMGAERRVRELKAENRLLRRLAGWEEGSDSEEEDEAVREELGLH